MIGVLELNDIANLIKEKTEKSLLMTAGVFEAKKEGVVGLAKARFTWLFVNFITASIASSVITVFEPLVASFAVLATFTPIVASIGGNTGNQSSAVIIRSLAIKAFEGKAVLNEMATALLNSVLFSSIAFILSYALHHNLLLSLSFGLAIFININVGAIIGSSIPVLISKLKIDPALCSSIFVTMMTDMIGFFSFLGIAYLLFSS
jgi:magnesium transporter